MFICIFFRILPVATFAHPDRILHPVTSVRCFQSFQLQLQQGLVVRPLQT